MYRTGQHHLKAPGKVFRVVFFSTPFITLNLHNSTHNTIPFFGQILFFSNVPRYINFGMLGGVCGGCSPSVEGWCVESLFRPRA